MPAKWPKEKHELALQLFHEGLKYYTIGKRIGKSRDAVEHWASVNGLRRAPQRKKKENKGE
jgi:hypothetical protein